jgi:phospholipid-binding lipoprotein MlaA
MTGRLKLLLITMVVTFTCTNLKAQNIFDYEDDEASFESKYDIHDPWEKINRKVYNFNHFIDKHSIRPAAKLYGKNVPKSLQAGLKNFNNNLHKPLSSLTSLLMLDFKNAAYNLKSFAINSSFGFFGLFNISYHITKHEENKNFANFLSQYDVPQGIYLVLPFIGSQTTRNLSGLVLNSTLNPIYLPNYGDEQKITLGIASTVTTGLDLRFENFNNINSIYDDSFDSYITMRNIYYQMQ